MPVHPPSLCPPGPRPLVLTLALGFWVATPVGALQVMGDGAHGQHVHHMAEHHSPDGTEPGFVEVTGSGEVMVETDEAVLTFAVETEAGTARAAGTANANLMEGVRQALRVGGGPNARLETFGYMVEPLYRRPSSGDSAPRIDGYRARNQIRVTLSGVEAVGELIDAALDAGANRVAGLAFQARDTREARLEALRMAVDRAHSEALVMAQALGVELGPPLEVRGGSQLPGPRFYGGMEMAMARTVPTTPVEAGSQTVTATVTVRYGLGERGAPAGH
ncbi:MAG: SIMPL domain-containing protein [Gemmatimonadota bacterium]